MAIATKTPSTEVLLATEGRAPHGDTLLSMLDPPYCFDIVRKSPFPGGDKSARPLKRSRISVDLGILEDVQGSSMAEDEIHGYTRQEVSASSSADACASGGGRREAVIPPTEQPILGHSPSPIEERERLGTEDERIREHEENQSMQEQDQNVRAIRVTRPRDEFTCQYIEPLSVNDLVEHLARAKKMDEETRIHPLSSQESDRSY